MELKFFTQPTPNPNALKFIFNKDVKTKGKITYGNAEECEKNAMAMSLFAVDGVTKAHFFENVITITQDGSAEWETLEDEVIELVRSQIADHDPDFKHGIDEDERRAKLPENIRQIEEILDRTVRQGLQADGGDIAVKEYDEEKNMLYVQYEGACVTCPSSTIGTLAAIKSFLKAEFNSEIDVQIV
ncbi:MAG: NifU family protein [Lentisphaeraceae bacterium]|nr:NifU family protein [Lentisphaeraceae bacterium]